ncbi:MucB/RseB-like sigma(E) regulatory protein [Plasticicumulans lactativorans]|uniref:MucB/RseB-like sigma(E) regulatory protein n=1 Tax=Plasticicumulans lactativorans TaxID=1133106 RepID=A0A4V2SCS1_9GAMM|nr:MucB/RseB C-terminal domain-containing protein [Plasticicumulans lactativorans]TCO80430.1 MucB/RseB-like sigma(E) regulatory protein [Plasticicumulans lactativorans]
MWRAIGWCVALLPFLLAPAVADENEAGAWLADTVGRESGINYEGTFVYSEGGRIEAMHIVHGQGERGGWQRLVSLSGPHREVLVANDDLTCSMPGGDVALRGRKLFSALPSGLGKDLSHLDAHYRFTFAGEDRVAGYSTRVVSIEPRDELRFGYRLWIEPRSGIVMRSVLFDSAGVPVEQLMFTELRLLDQAPAEPAAVATTSDSQTAGQLRELPEAQRHWVAGRLPPGFEEVRNSTFTRRGESHGTEHMVYTDGLATLSVFIEPLEGEQPLFEGHSRFGAMNAFGRALDGHQVVAVGEVPRSTVEMVAQSIAPLPGKP